MKYSRITAYISALFLITIAIIGINSVASATETTHCGSQCNGKVATWQVPSLGTDCKSSRRDIASGSVRATYEKYEGRRVPPTLATEVDPNLNLLVRYSGTCQTLWGVPSGQNAANQNCKITLTRTISTTWTQSYPCANEVPSPMVDDYAPNGGTAAQIVIREQLWRDVCTDVDYAGNCSAHATQLVTFAYGKAF